MSETTTGQPEPLHYLLRDMRREARVSAESVAERMGLTPSSLRARERGEREWHRSDVQAYVNAVKSLVREREPLPTAEARLVASWFRRRTEQIGQAVRAEGLPPDRRVRMAA